MERKRIKSPCIDVCKLEDGVCIGCKRTKEEIARWRDMEDEEKLQVIDNCNKRKDIDNYDRYA